MIFTFVFKILSSEIVIRECNLIVPTIAWSTRQNLHKLYARIVQITINYRELSTGNASRNKRNSHPSRRYNQDKRNERMDRREDLEALRITSDRDLSVALAHSNPYPLSGWLVINVTFSRLLPTSAFFPFRPFAVIESRIYPTRQSRGYLQKLRPDAAPPPFSLSLAKRQQRREGEKKGSGNKRGMKKLYQKRGSLFWLLKKKEQLPMQTGKMRCKRKKEKKRKGRGRNSDSPG